jgi:hypothetical protein
MTRWIWRAEFYSPSFPRERYVVKCERGQWVGVVDASADG